MNVGFVETMRGSITTRDGAQARIEFEVSAHAPHLRQFLKDGKTAITGILRAEGIAREAPARGTLVIDLPRALTYAVDFEANGSRYHLAGKKTPSVLSPFKSMSEMEVVLTKDGAEVGRGQMVFDLRELPGFLASWLPFHARPRLSLDVRRRLLERTALDAP
jgi:hypothetical protein